jgi:predicted MPP superfamily phosphohydrolase
MDDEMRICWTTNLYLNFLCSIGIEDFCKEILAIDADAILITGDISTPGILCSQLKYLVEALKKPIYFILGNHDYYGSKARGNNGNSYR